jgi:ubiquitin carboxyl-terminal hydrolase 8
MSPMAVGKPHTRTFSVDSGATVNMPSSPANIKAVEELKSPKRIFPHLDDLVIAKPNVDVKSPLRTILQQGDLLARQADTHLDFRRPDIALQEYVSASVIAVDIVPRHPDYLALQKDRGELYRLYMGLNKRINLQHGKFAEVKELIKEDNARTGVKPSSGPGIISTNGHGTQSEMKLDAVGRTNGYSNSIPTKKKPAPAIQPKPDALHGKAIPTSDGVSDLAARFARLQNGGPVQDPRINTRPINISSSTVSSTTSSQTSYGSGHTMTRPAGPREIPSSISQQSLTKLPLDVVLSGMPRAPDAIHHSPLRTAGTPDVEAANLPSSVSRNTSFLSKGRKDSAPPISTVGPSPFVSDDRAEYFSSPLHSSHDNIAPVNTAKRNLPPPDATTITAEDLVGYLKRGQQALKVLIVDLRNREEFDSGHILSQSTICVEPITLRHGISGEELTDSMIIAPTSEQNLFERRREFDLLVFYDQSSSSIKSSSLGKTDDSVLRDFAAAVYDFGYEQRLKRRPVLLAGGLDAWVDLLGPYALQASTNGDGPTSTASLRKISSLSTARREALLAAKRKARPSRVGTKKEEDEWESVMKNDRASARYGDSEELSYARTQDEFLRRYPEVPVQESMVSTSPASFKHSLEDSLPRPPARPAPALPRQRSSGITEKSVSLRFAQPAGGPSNNLVVPPGITGLKNTSQTCYLNSALQLLSNSRNLRMMLMNFQPGSRPVPQKAGETSPPLQLMTRAVGNLLAHMWSGFYASLDPVTLKVGATGPVHHSILTSNRVILMPLIVLQITQPDLGQIERTLMVARYSMIPASLFSG